MSENANFCFFSVLETCLRRGSLTSKNPKKCAYVIHEWSLVYIFCIGTCTIEHSSYIEEMNRTDQTFIDIAPHLFIISYFVALKVISRL